MSGYLDNRVTQIQKTELSQVSQVEVWDRFALNTLWLDDWLMDFI